MARPSNAQSAITAQAEPTSNLAQLERTMAKHLKRPLAPVFLVLKAIGAQERP
jgi:hypothetical protein